MKKNKMKLIISVSGFLVATPFLLSLLFVGAFFYYYGKIFRQEDWRKYGLHISYGVDQLGNALLMGKPAQTISTRIHLALKSGRPRWWVPALGNFVDILAKFIAGEDSHIAKSDEDLLGDKELLSWISDD